MRSGSASAPRPDSATALPTLSRARPFEGWGKFPNPLPGAAIGFLLVGNFPTSMNLAAFTAAFGKALLCRRPLQPGEIPHAGKEGGRGKKKTLGGNSPKGLSVRAHGALRI
jgi:hypothetical protein